MATTAEVAREFMTKMAAGDFEAGFAMMADDVQFIVNGTARSSGVYNGKKDLTERLSPMLSLLKNLKVEIKEYIVEGNRAVVLTRGEADAPYGPYLQDPAVILLRIENGKVVEMREAVDTIMIERAVYGAKLS